MKTRLVRIGNSIGVRIPKAILKQSELPEEVDLSVSRHRIVIRPARHPREGWKEAFFKAGAGKEELLIDDNLQTDWDRDEWRW
jgi:antitoxin MazE